MSAVGRGSSALERRRPRARVHGTERRFGCGLLAPRRSGRKLGEGGACGLRHGNLRWGSIWGHET
eukprot:6077338-Pyramimonas_sp.AAC.1